MLSRTHQTSYRIRKCFSLQPLASLNKVFWNFKFFAVHLSSRADFSFLPYYRYSGFYNAEFASFYYSSVFFQQPKYPSWPFHSKILYNFHFLAPLPVQKKPFRQIKNGVPLSWFLHQIRYSICSILPLQLWVWLSERLCKRCVESFQ